MQALLQSWISLVLMYNKTRMRLPIATQELWCHSSSDGAYESLECIPPIQTPLSPPWQHLLHEKAVELRVGYFLSLIAARELAIDFHVVPSLSSPVAYMMYPFTWFWTALTWKLFVWRILGFFSKHRHKYIKLTDRQQYLPKDSLVTVHIFVSLVLQSIEEAL